MSVIHEVEKKSRFGSKYVASISLLVISILAGTWIGFFLFLPVKSGMSIVDSLEERFLPRAEGMVLDFTSLSEPSIIISSDATELAELHDGLNRDLIPLSEIPPFVVNTLLAAEDSNYYKHEGVDFIAIASAVLDNLRGITRGGSTITSQVAKLSFVGDEISIRRKITEAVVAAELERRYTKDQILEYYLNSIYWGSGAYGIKSASYEYFDKNVDELTLDEAATLVVIIRSPAYYNPRKYPERVLERRNGVLETMLREKFIVEVQYRAAKIAPLNIAESKILENPAEHVVAEVKRQLLNDPQFAFLGKTNAERKQALFGCPSDDVTCTGGGGLKIYTTLDLGLQEHANEVLNKWVPPDLSGDEEADPRPTGVITLLDNYSGAIRVMASGLPFEEEQYNLATQGKRNPGSAFKPITLLAALESGTKLYSNRDSRSPVEINCGYPCAPDGVGTKWVVRNYGTSITADRFLSKFPALDRAIELQCVDTHIEEIKTKDFIDQFPLVEDIDEYETEEEKLLAIGTALGQYDEEGNPVLMDEEGKKYVINENRERVYFDIEGRKILSDEDGIRYVLGKDSLGLEDIKIYAFEEQEIIEDLSTLDEFISIDPESEYQYVYKPCLNKSTYNISIRRLDDSGMISLEEATRRSVNTVFAQVASELGGEKLASTAKKLGISSYLDPVISLTLGAGAVTPIEMASAYSSFATNGVLAPPYLIERIEDTDGNILYQHITSPRVSIADPGAAAAVRKTLEVAAQRGTGTRALLDDRNIAGKTGTHQGFREAWFIGFIPQYTSSVWIGFAEEQLPLRNVTINGEVYRTVSGGRVPAPIWKEFMDKVIEDLPIQNWPTSPSDIDKYYEIPTGEIPELTGLNVLDAEEISFSSYFLPIVNLVNSEEEPGVVLSQSVEAGEEMPEGTEIILEVASSPLSASIPSIAPCATTLEEAENLFKKFMRDTGVVVFLDYSYENTNIQTCDGKILGTNVSQGAVVSSGDTILLIVSSTTED